MKIRHIINPVVVQPTSDLFIAQPITFASMIAACKTAESEGIKVDLCFTCYEEDMQIAPREFRDAGMLERSILDIRPMSRPRKLPLIRDIIDRALIGEPVDLIIYTNVDIAVQPHFYIEVVRISMQGYDAFTINRRTLPKHYNSPAQLELMYRDSGEKHPGHDCFVFKPEDAHRYDLGLGCIGANWIGRILLVNLMARSTRFHIFDNKRLTFHIGDDRSWKVPEFNGYDNHNEQELVKILEVMLQDPEVNHVDELRKMYNMHRERLYSRRMVQEHTFSRPLPAPPERFIPASFKGSVEWKTPLLLDQSPIFIVGYPRSGTTLLQSKLMTQSGIVSLPETHFFSIVRNRLRVQNDTIEPDSLDSALDKLRERYPLSIEMEEAIRNVAARGYLSPKMFFEAIVADGIIKNYDLDTISRSRFVEKTPDHAEYLEIILRWYPRAKIVYIVRHPEKAIVSRRQNFAGEEKWPIQDHALRWKASVAVIDKYRNDKRFMSVRLEDLIADETTIMARICAFIGIQFDVQSLSSAPAMADKIALSWERWKSDNRKVISAHIAHRKSRRLNWKDRKVLHSIASEEIEALGYTLETESDPHLDEISKSVVVFSHIPSHPSTHGNSKRIRAICQSLKDLGFKVNFFYYLVHPNLPVDFEGMIDAWDDVRVYTRRSPMPVSKDGYFEIDDACEKGLPERFAAYCEEKSAQVALVNYVFYSCVFSLLPPNVLRILDTHDCFADRHLKLKAAGVPAHLWWFSFKPAEEGIGLSRADIVVAIQEEEAKYFSTVTEQHVAVLPHLELQQTDAREPAIPFRRAGFLGSDNPINIEAAKKLVDCYTNSGNRDHLPELVIAGRVCEKIVADDPKIILLGPLETLDQFYDAVDVIVIPIEFGTGLKIKAVEALAHGLPIISTSHGSIGLDSKHTLLNLSGVQEIVSELSELSRPYAKQRALELSEHCASLFESYQAKAKKALKAILDRMVKSNSLTTLVRQQRDTNKTTSALILESRALLSRFTPNVSSLGMRALFVGHGFHQRTNSSKFFIEYLESIFDLKCYWLTPHEADTNYPREFIGFFDFAFFWQIMPDKRIIDYFSADRVVCIPMYDATGVYESDKFNPERWLPMKEYPFISFCRTFHHDLKNIGIQSFYLQYAPRTLPALTMCREYSERPKVLFLYRRPEISWDIVKRLLAPEDVESIHIHVMTDPKHQFVAPSKADMNAYNITISTWFDDRSDYDALLDNHDIFIAPRLYEGIGMAFIDAMVRGLCVVAPDRPTMIEYIEHKVCGLLFDPALPTRLDISNWKELGMAGRKKMEKLSHNFDTDSKILRLFLKSQMVVPGIASMEKASVGASQIRRKILLVFPHNPLLRNNGVQTRFLGLLEYFRSRRFVVDLLSHTNFVDKWEEDDAQVKRLVRNLYLEDFVQAKASGLTTGVANTPLPDFAFRSLKSRFDQLICAGSYDLIVIGYVHWANLIRDVAGIRTVIMVEDCISQNLMERHGGEGKFDYDASFQEEARRLDMFDVAAFISPEEMKLFSRICHNVKMFHVPHLLDIPMDSKKGQVFCNRRYDLIFVGSDNPFNLSAMHWFLSKVWPHIGATTTLAVVGAVCDELRKYGNLPNANNLYMLGRVDDLDLVYDKSKIAICPMLHGTGLKIKVAEALAHGLPVVALPGGLIGMTGDKQGCVEVRTPEQFELAIRSILESQDKWVAMSSMARKTAKELFGRKQVAKSLDAMFDYLKVLKSLSRDRFSVILS